MLAVGKAAAAMAREIERRIGDKLADALAVVPKVPPRQRSRPDRVCGIKDASPRVGPSCTRRVIRGCGACGVRNVAWGGRRRPGDCRAERRRVGDAHVAGRGDRAGGQDCGQSSDAQGRRVDSRAQRRAQASFGREGRTPDPPLRRRARARADPVRRAGQRPGDYRLGPDCGRLEQRRRRGRGDEAARWSGGVRPSRCADTWRGRWRAKATQR